MQSYGVMPGITRNEDDPLFCETSKKRMGDHNRRLIEDHDSYILEWDCVGLSFLSDNELRSSEGELTRATDEDDTFNHWQGKWYRGDRSGFFVP